MKRIVLAFSPAELQNKFAERARAIVNNNEVIGEAPHKIDDLVNSLIDRCMSGEIC